MWLGVDREAASEMEMATTGWHAEPDSMPPAWDPMETNAWSTADTASPVVKAEPPLLAMTEEELDRLARDEGWDESEVAAIRAMIARPATAAVVLPGAAELDDAMAALHGVPVEADAATGPPREWAKPPTGGDDEPAVYDDWAFQVEAAPPPTPAPAPLAAPRRPAADPGWLRRRQGRAANAYRTLRRLFPG